MNAVNLFLMVFVLHMTGSMVIAMVEKTPYLWAAYEVASALGTVGLTTGITSTLSRLSQCLLIGMMYIGRVGVLSISLGFLTRKKDGLDLKYPRFNIMIG